VAGLYRAEGAVRFFTQPLPNSSRSLLSHKENLKSPSLFSLTTFPTSFTCPEERKNGEKETNVFGIGCLNDM